MEKTREMNKRIFYDNLMLTIYEILGSDNINEKNIRCKIIPIYEKDKPYNAIDDSMRLVALSEKT